MIPDVHLRVALTETQAEQLQIRLNSVGMKVTYREEQHGTSLVVAIGCTRSQEKTLREMLSEIGVSIRAGD
jgi:hypothetical protein